MSEERDVDTLAIKGTVAEKLKDNRKYKQSRLDEIMNQGNMSPTRGNNPPQTGQKDMS